jgi:two-component system, LytTR family, sensor kinase
MSSLARQVPLVSSSSNGASRAIRWMAVSLAVWTLVFSLDIASLVFARAVSPEWLGPLPMSWSVLLRVAEWYSWWLWTPAIFYIARRFRFEPGTRVLSFAIHLIAALAIIRVNVEFVRAVRSSMGVSTMMPFVSMSNLVQYAGVCGAALILDFRRRERAHLLGAARLESQLAQSRMQALTAQLRPHFLYNALNSVAMLIRAGDRDQALDAVLGYGDLLRTTVGIHVHEVPLRDELAFVDRYLAIERMRFSDTLSATISSEPGLDDALVPSLVLQPLVENALHHGLRNVESGAQLEVIATRHAGTLRLEVRDNGAGLPNGWRLGCGTGVGLQSTQSRLREWYGDNHHFELHSRLDGGTAVIIELPFRIAATDAA